MTNELEQRARELLAAECGVTPASLSGTLPAAVHATTALRAIAAALRSADHSSLNAIYDSIIGSVSPDDPKLDVAYAIARYLRLDCPCAYEQPSAPEPVAWKLLDDVHKMLDVAIATPTGARVTIHLIRAIKLKQRIEDARLQRSAPPAPRSDDAQRESVAEAVREAWRIAIRLGNNICVQESDRENDNDGDPGWIDGTSECAKRIRGYEEPDDAQLIEMLTEGGAHRALAALGAGYPRESAAIEAAQEPGSVCIPRDELERTIKTLRYASHPAPSPHADALAKYLTAPLQREGANTAPLRPVTDEDVEAAWFAYKDGYIHGRSPIDVHKNALRSVLEKDRSRLAGEGA